MCDNKNYRNVFLYWIGKENVLINLLRKIIYYHSDNERNYKINFINHENIHKYINNLPQCFFNMKPAYQADYVRVCVICDYGGIWLDSDTIIMNNLHELFDLIENNNGFFIRENNKIICNGVFGSKPNTLLMTTWKQTLNDILNENIDVKSKNVRKLTGALVLKKILYSNKLLYKNYIIFNGLDNMYPINWSDCVEEFLNKPSDNYKNIERSFQPLIILVNSVYNNLENYSEDEILKLDCPLTYFINKSIKSTTN